MSKFQSYLDDLVEGITAEQVIKEAQLRTKNIPVNNSDTSGLLKLANIIKTVSIEPTYEELYSFVGGLHGRR